MNVGLARVTISAPQRRVDVAMPEHVPLAELLPDVLRYAGEGLADDGEGHGGWLLRRADGTALVSAQGLLSQGVRDGEVLYLVPAVAEWPELEYDDVVEAVAEGARRRGGRWGPGSTRTATLVGAGVLLAVGLLAVLGEGPAWGAAFTALAIAVLLTLTGVAASRAYGDARAGSGLGGYALPYGFAGGALLVSSGDPVGVLPGVSWLGREELLAGGLALLLVAALGAVGVAASVRIFTAGVVIGLFAALTAFVGHLTTAAGAAAVLVAVVVCSMGALPLLAVWFGKTPTPLVNVPTDSQASEVFTSATGTDARRDARLGAGGGAVPLDTARERPDRAVVFAAVTRAEELLTGMLGGYAMLAVGAFGVLAVAGGSSARALVGVGAAAVLLRARLFVTLRQRAPLVAAGLLGIAMLGADLLSQASADARLVLAVCTLLLAVSTVVAGSTYSRRPPSPYLGRAADLLDILVVVSVIPVACVVVGLFDRIGNVSL